MRKMKFNEFASYLQKLESTTKKLEMVSILKDLFSKLDEDELPLACYLLLGKLRPDYEQIELGIAARLLLRSVAKAASVSEAVVEKELKEKGDLGEATYELLKNKKIKKLVFSRELTIRDCYDTLLDLAKMSGKKSITQKVDALVGLLVDSSPLEAKYLVRITSGELRLGLADMTLMDALSETFLGSRDLREEVERAYNVYPDIGFIALTVKKYGLEGLKQVKITLGVPIRMALAERLSSAEEIIEKVGVPCAAEYKYDGERIQAHKKGNEILLYSRRLENITHQYPDVVELISKNTVAKELIIEMECIAIDPDTLEIRPFQELMQRRRKYDIEKVSKEIPVALRVFDILYVDGEQLLNLPYIKRREMLSRQIIENERITLSEMKIVNSSKELEDFFQKAIDAGMEGVMVKMLNSDYQAGARSYRWVKLKKEYKSELTDTLDLVVVGAYRGMGKRSKFKYGSFLMSVYDKKNDVFKTVCKVGTGFTEDDLAKLEKMLEPYIHKEKHPRVVSNMEADFWFIPKIVLEIIGAEITLSPVHTASLNKFKESAGLAIRFPRFTGRFREDKEAEQATTEEELEEMYQERLKKVEE
jgi:DNA ligase-1